MFLSLVDREKNWTRGLRPDDQIDEILRAKAVRNNGSARVRVGREVNPGEMRGE